MTRVQIEQSLHELNNMVLTGHALEAFEKYYHEDVVMQENDANLRCPRQQTNSVKSNFLAT